MIYDSFVQLFPMNLCLFFGKALPAKTTDGLGATAHLTFQYLAARMKSKQ